MVKRFLFVYLDQEKSGYGILRDRPNRSIQRKPQLGFQYLASVLEGIGVDSVILDQTITSFTVEELVKKIKDTSSDIVGFYSATILKDKVKSYIAGLKDKIDVPIIVGGPGSINGQQYLEAGCDIVCNGEGERTILEIVNYYNGKTSKDAIRGISYMESGRFIKNEPQYLIEDLNSLPFPRRNLVPIDYYHDYYILTMKKPYATLMVSRGCPMSCTFCTSHLIWRKRYRLRTVENVLREIDELRNAFDVKYIAFLDDIFGLDEIWLENFCKGIINRRYKIKWMCILHPFSLRKSKDKSLGLLRDAGCDTLSFGLQSADPQVLKNIRRSPEEPVELEETIKIAKRKGLLISIAFIFGLPGETVDTIRRTIDYCRRIRPTYVEFYNLDILEGSEMEAVYKLKENVCNISADELDFWCRYAARKFYMDPHHIFEILKVIITRNPSWLWMGLRNLKHFLGVIGY